MQDYIDKLTYSLRLTPYQSNILKHNVNKYNMGRLIKRGGVIYAPHASHGIYAYVVKLLRGVRADLIGQNKILVRNKRNIKFCNHGYHCVTLGRFKYYADAMGHNISKDEFFREIEH